MEETTKKRSSEFLVDEMTKTKGRRKYLGNEIFLTGIFKMLGGLKFFRSLQL